MIWCVEDDDSIREIEMYTLRSTGFEVRGFKDSQSFFDALKDKKEKRPQLVILDIMLPGEDGVQILRRLRLAPETNCLPVIMATAKGTEFDKIQSLDLGADDYLVKPFGMMEMVSRVKAVLRRAYPSLQPQLYVADDLILDPGQHIVQAGSQRIELTFKEFEILKLFLSNPGQVFTRENLMNTVWGTEYVGESRTVDMHIRTLRQKLGSHGQMIKTVRNVGYRLETEK